MRLASQLGARFDDALRERMPALDVVALPPGPPAEIAPDVTAMVALPFQQSGQMAPPRPAGWPFGLKWIQLVSVGTDLYPNWLFEGPSVSCARGATSEALAEFALAAIFAAAKDMPGIWIGSPEQWRPRSIGMVRGATLGIVGFGGIGRALAPRARALGMKVVVLRRSAAPLDDPEVERAESLEALFAQSDHVVLAAPATTETAGMISAEVLAAAKPGLHIVNIARGILVDDQALLVALDEKRLALATLDVAHPEPLPAGHPFFTHPQVRLSPHVAVMTPEIGRSLLDKLVGNIERLGAGQMPDDLVDPVRGY